MSSLRGIGIIGTGTIGVLSTGLLLSSMLKTGTEAIFGLAIFIFVSAGAIALIARSMR